MTPTKRFTVTLTFDADDTYGALRMEQFVADHMALHNSDHYTLTGVSAVEEPLA